MKKQLLFLISAIAFALHSVTIQAQDDNRQATISPDFKAWTENQIRQWSDSVKNVLYPPLETGTMKKPPETSKNNTDKVVSQLVFNNTYVPNSILIDKTKAVGEIPLSSAVSPSGALTYNVPIEVYHGIHGVQPQLSISYNSHAGNGVMGVGWNIGGLSSISRGNQSLYYDGKTQGVAMTKSDVFYLDGMRLIKLSETTTQIKYESEQGNIKATANLNGSIVKYFDVYYPNGTKGTYGYTTNTATNYLDFPLTSISDLYGNVIAYTYTYIENHFRITKISYANASVEFQYTTTNRTDVVTNYIGGLKIKEDKLLQKIICKYGGAVLRNYEFTYTFQKESSLLTQIGYSAANGASFNPLKFYYGENNMATTYTKNDTQLLQWYVWTDPNQIKVSKGKFDYGTDNDGLIVLPAKTSYWQTNTSSLKLFENLYSGTEDIFLYAGLNDTYASPMPNLKTENGFIDILCADIDGKWEEEVIKVNNIVSGSNDRVIFKTYSANLYAGLALKKTYTFDFPTVLAYSSNNSVHPKFYFTGDFNGDGKMEVLAVSCHQPFGNTSRPTKCYLFDLESGTKLYDNQPPFNYNVTFVGAQQTNPDIAEKNTDRLYVLDYDGDGKSDICLINANGTYIYTFNISGSFYSMQQVAFYSGLKRSDLDGKLLMLGDFNGDGKPDFLLSPKVNYNDWNIFYSKGDGQFEKVQVSIYPRNNTYKYCLQDVNSDGFTDVIEYTTSIHYTYRAKNGGFSSYESGTGFTYNTPLIIPSNINSRYSYSQLIALKDGKVTRFSYPRNDAKEKLLTGSATSLGVVNKNYYGRLNEYSGIYDKGSGAVYPYENFNGPLHVPIVREQYFNGTRNEYLFYTYQNAVIHKQGLGFKGFERLTIYDNVRGRTQYQKYDPYKYSELKEDDSPAAKNTYTYSYTVASNKIAKVRLTNQSSLDKLKNTTVTAAYTYDTYGNPLTETINYGGGITQTATNIYINNTNETGYLLGFLTDRTKIVNRNGSTWSERCYIPAYSNGQPSVKILYSNGNQALYETFAYDAKGNKTSHGVKSYSSTSTLTTGYVYDSYGRMTKQTDPLGLYTTYEYNTTNGSLSKVKNHKNQETTYSYDPFFRITGYTYPEGTNGSTAFSWDIAGLNGLYRKQVSETGKPVVKTYYDALGRETASSGLNFDNSESRIEKQYDNFGRLWKVSLPYKGTSASLWNTYQYDNYDRTTSVSEASGRTTTYSYSGNNMTTTREGIVSTQSFDTQGNLIQATDPGGTITYNLRPDGQPSSIVAPGSVTTSFTYDNYGRRLTIVDPSAGTQTYTYDAAGNIATEKDANNKTITYGYDYYNRMNKKTCPEFVANYRYNSDGQLACDSISSTRFTSYMYDTFGRLLKEKETIDGKWLEKTHNYANSYRDFTKFTSYTGDIVVENYYYTAGHLTEIKLNGTLSIWKLSATNAFGQPTKTINRFVTRDYEYSSTGYLEREKATTTANGVFFDYSYSFNAATGNLNFRKDNRINKQESFTYDNLNRLKTYFDGSVTYDSQGKGNIASKSEAGSNFQYTNSSKPYAITGLTTTGSLIPQRNQTATYTSFSRPETITENGYKATFTYNSAGDRVKMSVSYNNNLQYNRYYLGGRYELDENADGTSQQRLYLGGDAATATSLYLRAGNGNWYMIDLCRDYQGTLVNTIDVDGLAKHPRSYTVWGLERDGNTFQISTNPYYTNNRGYCGHEHLKEFGLINMNARLYDPAIGRFLSPDPFVQTPGFSQSFNRYAYCFNNPLIYTDPDGEIAWFLAAALIYGLFFTDVGYDIQKTFSPVAVKVDLRFGNHQGGIGIDASVGIPQAFPISYRVHGGATYFWKNEDLMGNNMSGWETRYGAKWSISGYALGVPLAFSYSGTTFNSKWSGKQTTNLMMLGNPFINLKYENDMEPMGPFKYIPFVPKGDGDRYRTAAAEFNFLGLGFGTKIMTGDAGPFRKDYAEEINGKETYMPNGKYDPNSHRMGLFYFKVGPFRFGKNSENTRKIFQNQFAHDFLTGGKSLWFEVLDLKPRWYWGFGYSGGSTLY